MSKLQIGDTVYTRALTGSPIACVVTAVLPDVIKVVNLSSDRPGVLFPHQAYLTEEEVELSKILSMMAHRFPIVQGR